MSNGKFTAASGLAIAVAIGVGTPAHSQDGQGLQDIVVTAQKRSENLQNVPISIAAITSVTAKALGVQNTTDLQFTTPGLVMHHQGFSLTPVLRGISTQGGGSPPEESPIAVYVDGVYMVAPSASVFSLNNIDRVEILKGPQGTLFGRNAVGGVINVITSTPSHEAKVKATAGYANFDTYEATFYGTTGVADNVAADLSVYWNHQNEGWGHYVAAPGQTNPAAGKPTYINRALAVRNKWSITPGDTTDIVISADYYKGENATGTARSLLPGTYAANSMIPNDVGPVGGFWDIRSNEYKQTAEYKQWGGSLTLNQEIGSIKLRNITAYRKTYVYVSGDQDSIELPVFNAVTPVTTRQFTEEVQLLSPDSSKVKWIAGLYYLHAEYFAPQYFTGSAFGPNGGNSSSNALNYVRTSSVAGFGQATVPLDAEERTNVTGGIRYTSDYQSIESYPYTVANAIAPVKVPGTPVAQSAKFSDPTWRVAIDHKFTSKVMAYASYNRGFKSGIFSATAPSTPAVRPTTLDAYELGVKAELFDNKLRMNVAGFYYKSKDIQLQVFSPTGTSLLLLNATSGTAKGVDVEIEAVPVRNLTIRLGGEYLDTQYLSFANAPVTVANPKGVGGTTTTRQDVSGSAFPYSPKWTANASILYTIPTSIGNFDMAVNYYHQSSFLGSFQRVGHPEEGFLQPSYDLWNASLGWKSPDETWSVKFWGKNLGNEKYFNHVTASNRRAAGSPGAPRTYGVTLGFNWGGR